MKPLISLTDDESEAQGWSLFEVKQAGFRAGNRPKLSGEPPPTRASAVIRQGTQSRATNNSSDASAAAERARASG